MQRRIIHDRRDALLQDEAGEEAWPLGLFREGPRLFARPKTASVPRPGRDRERRAALYHLDRGWSDHLAWVQDTRESIHLVSLGGRTPINEFHKAATDEFMALEDRIADAVAAEMITLTQKDELSPLDLERLKGPSSTWTYQVNEDQFGWGMGSSTGATSALPPWRLQSGSPPHLAEHFGLTCLRTGRVLMTGQQYMGRQGLSNDAFGFYADRRGNLFCITDMGIKKYDHASDRFIPFNPEGLTRYFLTTTIFEDSRGNMWFGTFNGGLYRQDGETGEMGFYDTRNGLWGNFVTWILEDYRGNIWVASMEDWESRGGITVFSPEGTLVFNNTNGLMAQHILCMIEDKEKNILIADRDAGLFIYKGDHFTSYSATAVPSFK